MVLDGLKAHFSIISRPVLIGIKFNRFSLSVLNPIQLTMFKRFEMTSHESLDLDKELFVMVSPSLSNGLSSALINTILVHHNATYTLLFS